MPTWPARMPAPRVKSVETSLDTARTSAYATSARQNLGPLAPLTFTWTKVADVAGNTDDCAKRVFTVQLSAGPTAKRIGAAFEQAQGGVGGLISFASGAIR